MRRLRSHLVLMSAVLACQSSVRDDDPFGSGDAGAASSGPASASADGSGADADADSQGSGDGPGSSGVGDETGDEIKLDVGSDGKVPPSCGAGEGCEMGCTAVDLLFVIDNSGSMGDYQAALGMAFPGFATTLSDVLPPGTNVHVGVTSTEMAYSSAGNSSITNGMCTFIGDGDQTNEAFYVPPTETDSGRNGAQGRLWDVGGGQTYAEFETGEDLGDAQAWFSNAANIGEGGSNIEMYAAPVGWVFDPENAATNDGFLRDEGAVLVVFFLGDEPDQSPATIDGEPAGGWILDRVAAAKAGCGGLQCVIAGGFLQSNACSADGNLPLDDFLAGMDDEPVVAALPDTGPFGGSSPAEIAEEMNALLSSTLASVIVETCEEITPEG